MKAAKFRIYILCPMSCLSLLCYPKWAAWCSKLTFLKASDCVSCDFLDHLLKRYDFGVKWRGWLQSCWKTASFSILLNGSPGESFKSTRGLRRGDPLSPMIIVLAAEVLTQMFLRAQEVGALNGF